MRMLRPHHYLVTQGLIACVAFLTPVFVVLYFLTVPNGPWVAVLVTHIIAAVIVTLAASGYYAATIWIGPGTISERGYFLKRSSFTKPQIASAYLTYTFATHGDDPTPQLFVRDAEGHTLVRMRGQFWSRESMDAVIDALAVPTTISDRVVSISELRSDSPSLLYWFERHPVIAALVFTGIIATVGGIILLVVKTVEPS